MGAVIEDALNTRLSWLGLSAFLSGMDSVARGFGLVDKNATAAQKSALSSAAAYGAAATGLAALLIRSGMQSGQMGRLENSLTSVTGSAAAAQEQIGAIRGTSASQLFGTDTAARAALNLRNMGADLEFTQLAMSAMANATAAAAGDQNDFMAATEAVSRALQMQRVDMRSMRQLMRASGPAFKEMADSLGVTVQQFEGMEFHGPQAIEMLRRFLDQVNRTQGGAATRDLNTLPGQINRLQNALGDTGRAIGDSLSDPLRDAAKNAADLVTSFNRLPRSVHHAAASVGVGLSAILGARSLTGLAGFLSRLPMFAGVAARVASVAGVIKGATPYGLAGLAMEFGSSFIPEKFSRQRHLLQGAGAGVGIGALAGAALAPFAGPETIPAGAALGGLIGALLASMGEDAKKKQGAGSSKTAADPHLTELQKQTSALEKIAGDIATMARGEVVSTSDVPGGFQALAAMRLAGMMR